MSYILDALRKLDSETRRSKKNIDLRETLFRDEMIPESVKKRHKSPFFIALSASLLTAVLFALLITLYALSTTKREGKDYPLQKSVKQVNSGEEKSGIPLTNVRDKEKPGFTLSSIKNMEGQKKADLAGKKGSFKPSAKEIKVAGIAEKDYDRESETSSDLSAEKQRDHESLPQFKISGALYHGSGSAANFLFIVYHSISYKLGEGESAGELTLVKIFPDKALFRFKERDFYRSY